MSYNPPPKCESNFNFPETRRNFSPNTGTDFYSQIQKIGAIGVVELSETPLEHGCYHALSCTPFASVGVISNELSIQLPHFMLHSAPP